MVASGVTITSEQIVAQIQQTLGTDVSVEIRAGGDQEEYEIGRLESFVSCARFHDDYPLQILERFVPNLATDSRQ